MTTWLVTGGAGFIGSNFVRRARAESRARIVNLDKFTYAGQECNLTTVASDPGHILVQGDIAEGALVDKLLVEHAPEAVINFAAESNVDRSIAHPRAFIDTNVTGTLALLESVTRFWRGLKPGVQRAFRFLHISTDEVYGNLESLAPAFTERHPFRPNSPYAASKAAADHLVRAFLQTFGLPTLTVHSTNNYGPHQHLEKLIPVMVLNARARKPLPIYGDGKQTRDWLHVDDHCEALMLVLEKGRVGESYNVGGDCERSNLQIAGAICRILDDLFPSPTPHARLIRHVNDRPGHDRRYAVDTEKLRDYTGWRPRIAFDDGLAQTVNWYLANADWVLAASSPQHEEWMRQNYESRGGVG